MSNERDKLVKATTDMALTSKFIQDVGQKATVERSSIDNEYMDQLREVVADVGRDLLTIGAVPKGMQYCGSLCIHIYKSEILKTAAFATSSPVGSLTYDLADGGLRELTGSTMEQFGKTRAKLRSGF